MASIDDDIETVRSLAIDSWERGNLGLWLIESCVVMAWRIARAFGAK